MHIVVCCATRRGQSFLQRLTELMPGCRLTVFSFREEECEPPFLDGLRSLATDRGGAFLQARQVGGSRWDSFWDAAVVDLMLAVSWRYRIPRHVFCRPRLGTYVFHDSLLPEYRGFSPTVWAIANGEDHTGVTLFEIADAIDAGPIVDQSSVPIGRDDTIAVVMERVTRAYLEILERNLPALLNGSARRVPQDPSRATYTCRRLPEDNEIDWTASSSRIHNLIRAVTTPYSGAFTYLSGRLLRVWAARRLEDAPRYVGSVPGRVVEVRPAHGAVVLAGDGPLLLTQVQLEGGERACAADVLNRINRTLGRRAVEKVGG